jgi:hypothetical protein
LVKKNLVKIGINIFCFEEKTFEFFYFSRVSITNF